MTDSTYTPVFDSLGSIDGAIGMLDQQVWLFEHMLLMPKYQSWVQRTVSYERASGTTSIEGVGLDPEAVSELSKKVGGRLDEAEQANVNALRAYEFVDYLSDQSDIPLDELVIRQLNREFGHGTSDMLTPGVYRKGQNKINDFVPPNQGDVPALMREFAVWLRDESELNPVLKAGLAHLHLVAIHPFWDGNGRTARAVATLILQRSGYGLNRLLSLESFFAGIREEYIRAIERTLGTRFNRKYDATTWLDFFALGVYAAATTVTAKLTQWHQMMEGFHNAFGDFGLNHRQIDGLMFALHTGRITRSDYMEITGISPITATRDLRRLVEAGALKAYGNTRNRIYRYEKEPAEPDPDRQLPEVPAEQGELPLDAG